ncbi:MAG: twitching motility protein PilT [Spirochaetae bacterium HGW-Spirochaetae-1]|jgi:hypothetical protein|nr:MAG: twitching motility protein PilT [Spirochaetae bacterium HGW-Spirochaetae-1]
MYGVTIRFYEELNDFLDRSQRKIDIPFTFTGRRSIKDLIESFGIPHVEVDLILVNGESVDFDRIVEDGDRISVYPVFERLNIRSATRLRPHPLRQVRFVLDVHLRKLARRLRLLGFDVDYEAGRDDDELAFISDRDSRLLLTRDRQLLMRKIVDRGLYVRNTDSEKQVREVLDRLDIRDLCRPFSRCLECNGPMAVFDYEENRDVLERHVPPGVLEWCREYYRCGQCGKLYWKGSHYDRLEQVIEAIMNPDAPDGEDG